MKKVLLYFFIIPIILILSSCETTEPTPHVNPPGYQKQIKWPSLADSPWPMFHGDAQLTGRSPYQGPTQGIVLHKIPAPYMMSGISLGYNSVIYHTSQGRLIASDYNGNKIWELYNSVEIPTTPLVGKDSTIYFANASLERVYAVNNDGSIKWEYKAESDIWNSTLGIDRKGNIYFTTKSTLTVLSPDGNLLWELNDSRMLGNSLSGFAFSPDGRYIYLQGNSVSLLEVDTITKEVIWTFGDRRLNVAPVVDNQGNIYIFPSAIRDEDNYFYCLTPTGEIRWKYKHDESSFIIANNVEPAIDKNGNIYFGFYNLYSLDYSGKLRWKVSLNGDGIVSPLLVDNSSNIFIGTTASKVVSFNNEGVKNWELLLSDWALGSSGAITENGLLIYPTFESDNYYIIK